MTYKLYYAIARIYYNKEKRTEGKNILINRNKTTTTFPFRQYIILYEYFFISKEYKKINEEKSADKTHRQCY